MAHIPCFEGQLFLHAPPPNSWSIPMLHEKKLDSVLGLERWSGMLCGYFGIATLTLKLTINTRSLYFNMKYQQQNGKLKMSRAII